MPEFLERLEHVLGEGFRVERELGGGGMSRVFLVHDDSLDRQIVVKVLPPELAAELSTERFKREILLAARLQHPHIVPLLTAGAREGLLYYVMPFIDGESLRARLARHVSCATSRTRSRSPTPTASFIATSSPITCSWPATTHWSRTSACRGRCPMRGTSPSHRSEWR
jgi:serine/threonine protein kinase